MEAFDRQLCEAEVLDRQLEADKLVSPANP
jgi:hypothetical protein